MPLRHSLCVSVGGQELFSCSLLVSYLGLSNFSAFTALPVLGWTVGLDWGVLEAVGVRSAARTRICLHCARRHGAIASVVRTLPPDRRREIITQIVQLTA